MTDKKIKALVFDFDGVIIADSEFIKEEAWEIIRQELGSNSAAVLKQARVKYSAGRGSRYDILKDSLLTLGYQPPKIDRLIQYYAHRYNEIVQAELLKKEIKKDDKATLWQLSKNYSLYINSATPEEAVQESVKNLGIAKFFKGIYGQPKNKLENLVRVLKTEKIKSREMFFIGDSSGDYEAAQRVGCGFIGSVNNWNKWSEKQFTLIKNLSEIEKYI